MSTGRGEGRCPWGGFKSHENGGYGDQESADGGRGGVHDLDVAAAPKSTCTFGEEFGPQVEQQQKEELCWSLDKHLLQIRCTTSHQVFMASKCLSATLSAYGSMSGRGRKSPEEIRS